VHSRIRLVSRVLLKQDLLARFFRPAAPALPQPEGPHPEERFDPNNLSVPADTMEHWKHHILQGGDLTQVPGIDEANARQLKAAGIANIEMLLGSYFGQKGPDVHSFDRVNHHKKFFLWLGSEVGIVFHRSTIVHAIGVKVSLHFPTIYDPADFDDEDDESEDDEPEGI
jgi:hypothetical protein